MASVLARKVVSLYTIKYFSMTTEAIA